jgi:16S rRNA (cytosine967-C5)-methyltransferase
VSGENPREIAARVLARREKGDFVEDLLEQALSGSRLSQPDRRLCQELVYGVVRWQATLDWLISRKTNRPQKKPLQELLRLGLYQLFWLERIPDHAAVHETVELARRGGCGPQSGFVNALLRGYLREAEASRLALDELKTEQPWLGYSHPEWLVARWQERWGLNQAASLMLWNNTPSKTYARVNTLKIEPGQLLERWRDENVEYDFVRRDWLQENLVFELRSHPSLARLASFQAGLFYVQDPSTLLAVRELDPQPGETILDLCAAPGGKLTWMAQLMKNEGKLVAHDVSLERIQLINENCGRLGVTCVQTICSGQSPAGDPAAAINAQRSTLGLPRHFDRVLVDAPCSNTGVMRRRVDLRWRIRPEEIDRLRRTQLTMLTNAAELLRPDGQIVYSTCSLEPEENESVVTDFLSSRPGFKLEAQRTLLPQVDNVDGAYVARLRRVA